MSLLPRVLKPRLAWGVALALLALPAASAAVATSLARELPSGRTALQLGDVLVLPEAIDAQGWPRSIAFGNAWSGAVAYYEFAPGVSPARRDLARSAMAQWSADTAIRAVESSSAGNRILISDDPDNIGCGSSFVGMIGGVQDLLIRCWNPRTLAHEFGHALGATHEHQRSDRNGFVAISDPDNLAGTYPAVFNTNWGIRPGGSVNSSYDFASVMHYASVGCVSIDEESYCVTLTALGAQPPGAPSSSETFCATPAQCTSAMGQDEVSPRDVYGAALRYGHRLDQAEAGRTIEGTLEVSGHIDTCGPDCWRFAAGATATVSLTPAAGRIAVLGGRDCDLRSAAAITCQIVVDRNRGFVALTYAPQSLLPLLDDVPLPAAVFADGFEGG
jgi:hypothetical protein